MPTDIIEQLIGTSEGWDQHDVMAFSFDKPSKFPNAQVAFIDFGDGRCTIQNFSENGELVKEEHFAIKVTLEPCEAPEIPVDPDGNF